MAKQCAVCGNRIGFSDDSKRINDTNELVCMKCFRTISDYTDKMWKTENKDEISGIKDEAKQSIDANISSQQGRNILHALLDSETNRRLEYIRDIEDSQNTDKVEYDFTPSPISDKYNELCGKLLLSTASSLEGYIITKQLGVVYGETVFKPSIGKALNARIDDFIDSLAVFSSREMTGRVSLIVEARKYAYVKMMNDALSRGANAIISIDTDNTFGGEYWYVSLYGTAVYAEKKE